MGLLSSMVAGGVAESAGGIGQRIRTEAKEAFTKRMKDESYAASKGLQDDRIAAVTEREATREANLTNRTKADREYQATLTKKEKEHQRGLLEKKQEYEKRTNLYLDKEGNLSKEGTGIPAFQEDKSGRRYDMRRTSKGGGKESTQQKNLRAYQKRVEAIEDNDEITADQAESLILAARNRYSIGSGVAKARGMSELEIKGLTSEVRKGTEPQFLQDLVNIGKYSDSDIAAISQYLSPRMAGASGGLLETKGEDEVTETEEPAISEKRKTLAEQAGDIYSQEAPVGLLGEAVTSGLEVSERMKAEDERRGYSDYELNRAKDQVFRRIQKNVKPTEDAINRLLELQKMGAKLTEDEQSALDLAIRNK